MIKLCVGGAIYEMEASCLDRFPDSLLAHLYSENSGILPASLKQTISVDRPPALFPAIMDLYRSVNVVSLYKEYACIHLPARSLAVDQGSNMHGWGG